ncbi:hypothetical protein BX257_8960 [Streptomyces sp. 3212.3]|nr:hypothetical protein BX257_8960 [Streptomyces sp. 3212.3]
MKLLLLGGSVFAGRAFAAQGLRRGWEVTVFNPGRTQADLPGVHALHGDRTDQADLAALAAAGPNDAVVDVCGYVPREVAKSAAAPAEHADAYLFVSTINIYPHFPALPTDKSSPRHGGTADAGPQGGDHGRLKDRCEKAVRRAFPGRVVVLQPGLIVRPHDRARRTTAWLRRAARGGPMAVPGTGGPATAGHRRTRPRRLRPQPADRRTEGRHRGLPGTRRTGQRKLGRLPGCLRHRPPQAGPNSSTSTTRSSPTTTSNRGRSFRSGCHQAPNPRPPGPRRARRHRPPARTAARSRTPYTTRPPGRSHPAANRKPSKTTGTSAHRRRSCRPRKNKQSSPPTQPNSLKPSERPYGCPRSGPRCRTGDGHRDTAQAPGVLPHCLQPRVALPPPHHPSNSATIKTTLAPTTLENLAAAPRPTAPSRAAPPTTPPPPSRTPHPRTDEAQAEEPQ